MHITTFTNKKVCPIKLTHEDIDLVDILQSLSFKPRFGGFLPWNYSVLQHSINCAILAKRHNFTKRLILAALIHDLCESLSPAGDIPSPVKNVMCIFSLNQNKMLRFREFEDEVMSIIIKGLGINDKVSVNDTHDISIKNIDRQLCNSESLYIRGYKVWDDIPVVNNESDYFFKKVKPEKMREKFMEIYNECLS